MDALLGRQAKHLTATTPSGQGVGPCRRCGGTDIGPLAPEAIEGDIDLEALGILQCRRCGGIVHKALRR